MKSITKKRILLILGIIALLVTIKYIKIPCLFHELTSFYCPSCGMTRAVFSLLEFKILDSLHNNVFIILIVYLTIKYFITGNIKMNKKIVIILLFFIIFYGILRNINIEQFNILRPM